VETLTSSSLLHDVPVVLDIGFGTGEAVIAMAQTDPDVVILAADTHTPASMISWPPCRSQTFPT